MASAGLKRSGTVQAQAPTNSQDSTPPGASPGPEEHDENVYDTEDPALYDEEYPGHLYHNMNQGQPPVPNSIGRQSPWAANDWRTTGASGFSTGNGTSSNLVMDDIQRALSTLELASNAQGALNQIYSPNPTTPNYQTGQSIHPPRFNPAHAPAALTPGMRNTGNNGNGSSSRAISVDFDGRKTPQSQSGSYFQSQYQQENRAPSAGGSWDSKDRGLVNRTSNPNLQYGFLQGGKGIGAGIPDVPSIPQQYLQTSRITSATFGLSSNPQGGNLGQSPEQSFIPSSIDVPSLIETKGYNPPNFDIRPQFVRLFVHVPSDPSWNSHHPRRGISSSNHTRRTTYISP